MRRVLAGIGLTGLVMAGAIGTASAAGSSHLTRIERPRTEQIVGNGKVRVVLRTRASLGSLRVLVDGRSVKRRLRRTRRGYRAVLRLGHGLRRGVNDLIVATRGKKDVDHVRFIVAQRDRRLLTMRKPRIGGVEAPARVVVRAARRSKLQAWLNGRRVTHAFLQQRRAYVGRLGANDGVRPGRNRLVVYTHRTARHGRAAVHDVKRLTFRRRRGRVTAGAGRDRRFRAGDFIALRGSTVGGGAVSSKVGRVKHRWRIVGQPRNSGAVLTGARTATPQLRARKAGIYRVRTRVTARNGSSSTDTLTAMVTEKVPPIGSLLSTTNDRGEITLNEKPAPNTAWTCASGPCVSWAVFDRQSLRLLDSGNGPGDAVGMAALAKKAAAIVPGPAATMVVNLSGASASLPDGKKLLTTLGAADIARPAIARPMSIIGVPGSPAGSAFVSDPSLQCAFANPACAAQPQRLANMTGYMRENQRSASGGFFEFVFADQREFTTDATPGTSQVTMKVGDDTYAHDVPAGASGFFLVMLNSGTLELNRPPQFFVTNNPNGSENPAEEKRMADLLAFAVSQYNSHGEVLVMLQAFGTPHGLDGAWLQAAAAIDGLGGNSQVFTQLNQGNPASPKRGRYALVGRPAMDGRAAESSESLTGRAGDGKLGGLLARGRDNRYQPSLSDPGGAVNDDLVTIVNRPSPPDGGFPDWPTPGQERAADLFGRDPDLLGVCQADPAVPCDIRQAYYTRMTGWETRLARLGGVLGDQACMLTGRGFTPEECKNVRVQLSKEIGRRNTVQDYFGPGGLQAPFSAGGAGLNAQLVDVPAVAAEIKAGVPVFPPNNATSNVFSILNFLVEKVSTGASLFGCEECEAIGFGLGNAFELAEYLTEDDGTPDLVGPELTSAATKLGGDLKDRYSRVSAYFTNEARVVMSDYSKMTQVAALAGSDPGWKLPEDPSTAGQILEFATKKTAYEALLPVAYPFLYDLGKSPGYTNPFNNARQWLCKGDPLNISYNKHLFQKTGDNSQMTWRMYDPKYFGQTHVIAVGARHTVLSLHSAYVPAPPDALTTKLFSEPTTLKGGMGFYKLDFFSRPNFKVFGTVLQQTSGVGLEFCHNVPNPPDNAG